MICKKNSKCEILGNGSMQNTQYSRKCMECQFFYFEKKDEIRSQLIESMRNFQERREIRKYIQDPWMASQIFS